ncbi:hypothetical protein KI387_022526, partial [Taxus chinensis]
DEIPSELEAAMSSALVHIAMSNALAHIAMSSALAHIAIFSENYAQSSWCLAELSLMLKTRTTIIPVFYGVKPSHLLWVVEGKGKHVDAFVNYVLEDRHTFEKLAEWNRALNEISLRKGYEYKISEVIKLLQLDNDKPVVGVIVYAIGGAGKTTLANEVYATLNLQGWKHSKLTLIKNMESHPNMEELQTQILWDLTRNYHHFYAGGVLVVN